MTTRDALLSELKTGHLGTTYWSDTKLELYLDRAIERLYPTWFQRNVDTTVAGTGPVQTMPSGATNVHEIVVHDGRPRYLRGWSEGDTDAYVPFSTDVTGKTLVWMWTAGWSAPATGATNMTMPTDAESAVVIMAKMAALQSLLTDKLQVDTHMAAQVRPNITEDELLGAIDALSRELRELADRALMRPEVRR